MTDMTDKPIGRLWDNAIPPVVTYSIVSYPPSTDCPPSEIDDILKQACEMWGNVSDFTPQKGQGPDLWDADFVFRFDKVSDANNLAEATRTSKQPKPGFRAVTTFDKARHWTSRKHDWDVPVQLGSLGVIVKLVESLEGKRDLLIVALHEIGHCLNLGHDTTHPESVMQPDLGQESETFAYFFPGTPKVPYCDAKALANEWGLSIEPFKAPQPVSGVQLIVGGRMEVTDIRSKTRAKTVPECSWGASQDSEVVTHDLLVAYGYTWNRFLGGRGYGRMYLHLADAIAPGTQTLLGGYIDYRQLNSKGTPKPDNDWGLSGAGPAGQNGRPPATQLLGFFEGWNRFLNGRGMLRCWGTVGNAIGEGNVPCALPVLGGRASVWQAGDSDKPEPRDVWSLKAGGSEILLAHANTYRKGWETAWANSFLRLDLEPEPVAVPPSGGTATQPRA